MTWLWVRADHLTVESRRVVLRTELSACTIGFVNGGREADLWGRAYRDEPGVERRAAAEFGALAAAAAAAAPPGSAVVIGQGLLARLVRAALSLGEGTAPAVVIDTTGVPARIQTAIERLPRCGRLVLAAPPLTEEVELATYADVHRRGLSIVGVPWPPPSGEPEDRRFVEEILQHAMHALPAMAAPEAPFYVLHPGKHA